MPHYWPGLSVSHVESLDISVPQLWQGRQPGDKYLRGRQRPGRQVQRGSSWPLWLGLHHQLQRRCWPTSRTLGDHPDCIPRGGFELVDESGVGQRWPGQLLLLPHTFALLVLEYVLGHLARVLRFVLPLDVDATTRHHRRLQVHRRHRRLCVLHVNGKSSIVRERERYARAITSTAARCIGQCEKRGNGIL